MYIYIHMCIYICTYIYTYMYTYIHILGDHCDETIFFDLVRKRGFWGKFRVSAMEFESARSAPPRHALIVEKDNYVSDNSWVSDGLPSCT